MSEPTKPIQVVVAYDFSPSAEVALERAVDVACRAPQHVLHIVCATEKHDFAHAQDVEATLFERAKLAFGDRQNASDVQFYIHARIGHAAEEILHLAHEVGADLIFIGSHGLTGLERLVLGSVSERVVREAKCPVMVAREKTYATVDLLHVYAYDHERKPYTAPRRYAPDPHPDITRPNDFPIS